MSSVAALFVCLACGGFFPAHIPWCTLCGAYGLIVVRGERPRSGLEDAIDTTTARELVGRAWKRLVVGAYDVALGPGALVAVMGNPGMGKSSLAVRLVDSIAAPVVIASYEEQPGPALAARLARCGAKRADLHIVGRCALDRLAEFVDQKKAVALVVDSVQVAGIRPRDLRKLMTIIPRLELVVGIAQANKQGEISGTMELAHESDVILRCEEMMWVATKSRFEPTPTEPRPILDLKTGQSTEE